MLEFCMSEWHVPPTQIVAEWSEELLGLMVERMIERKERQSKTSSSDGNTKQVVTEF